MTMSKKAQAEKAAARMVGKEAPLPPNTAPPQRTGETVTIACKLPGGLALRLHEWVETRVPVLGGGFQTEKIARATQDPIVIIRGNAVAANVRPRAEIVGHQGFALTRGVSKDFWDRWLAQNPDLPAVKNGLIFASPTTDRARDEAEDKIDLITNLEPLNTDTKMVRGKTVPADPRHPRSLNRNVGTLEPEEDQVKRRSTENAA